MGIRADLTSTEPIQDIIDKTVEAYGKLDILVNNAGILRRCDSIDLHLDICLPK